MTNEEESFDFRFGLANANRKLLEELNVMKKRLAIANRGMALLETVSTDWNEAADLVRQWKEVKPD